MLLQCLPQSVPSVASHSAASGGGVPGVRPPDTLTFKVRLTDWLPTVLHPCCRAAPRLPLRAVLPPSFVPLLILNCAKSAHLHQRRTPAGARNELATPLFSKGREILGSVCRYSMYVCTSYWVIWSAAAETWNYCCECTCEVATAKRTTPTTGAVAAPRRAYPRLGRAGAKWVDTISNSIYTLGSRWSMAVRSNWNRLSIFVPSLPIIWWFQSLGYTTKQVGM